MFISFSPNFKYAVLPLCIMCLQITVGNQGSVSNHQLFLNSTQRVLHIGTGFCYIVDGNCRQTQQQHRLLDANTKRQLPNDSHHIVIMEFKMRAITIQLSLVNIVNLF